MVTITTATTTVDIQIGLVRGEQTTASGATIGHQGHGKGHHGGYDPLWAHNSWKNHDGNHRGASTYTGNRDRGDHRDGDFNNGRSRQGARIGKFRG